MIRAYEGDNIVVDGAIIGTLASGSSVTTNPLYMFTYGGDPGNSLYTGRVKLYYCKIWDNGELVRDFVPVMDKSTWKASLYDRVNDVYYKSDTGVDFIPGPMSEDQG